MDAIQEPNHDFNFQKLLLSPPLSISSGNHFIKYYYNESPLYIQPPKCNIKQGITKIGKKMFCDLVFSIENEGFTHWLENLENYSQNYIFEKREKWFETSLEKHDIENSFSSPIKLIKSGKCFTLRANIPTILGKHSLKIYNESEQLLELEDLKENSSIVSVLEIQGIKCSTRGFQIDIEIKQLLVLNPVDIFQKCVLLHSNRSNESSHPTFDKKLPYVFETNEKCDLEYKQDDMIFVDSTENDVSKIVIDVCHETINDSDTNLLHNIPVISDDITLPCTIETNKDINNESITETNKDINNESITETNKYPSSLELTEINFNLEEIPTNDSLVLKNRNDVYYNMYREALRKAKLAKELSLSSYLEAKRIKNIYMLNDLSDEESEMESDFEIDDNNEK
jgi:hypothetical protein